ncbi:CatB-related O-acetyltransferase [Tepidibacter aestuarii]|uniref:CatB-related O-acetyltransferase n=1 Tax=Tepidibacter aestuarii TaxID=2925782 RepID=UPI0020C03A83|nr:CatB-related O-acetyltransferase [Tepidibacter aestuarii]CAH2212980.1 Chloramphenicol acetyltransferase [Tepidibacter aestuarii]
MGNKVFEGWTDSYFIKDNVKSKNIIAGDYSYYSGYYHDKHFEDICIRYLHPDRVDVDKLIIGKFCSIASGVVFIMAGNQGHRQDWISTYPFYYFDEFQDVNPNDGIKFSGDTIIGNDVWVGTEAIIMPGVKIGDGAIIGARAIVTKDVDPYTVVGGNPAKVIKKRFTDEEIRMLIEIEWWNWDVKKIKEYMPLITSNNIKIIYDISNI